MRKLTHKRGLAAFTVIGALVVAGAAIAYWTTSGSGTGTGAVASSNGTVVLHGVVTDPLYPGGSSPVTLTADNPGTSNLYVTSISKVSIATDAAHSGCLMADFTMPTVTENTMVAAGAVGTAMPNDGTLSFANTAANQDACKGAPLTLTLSSN